MISSYDIRKIWNPSWFQGNRRTTNYFEGWYFKLVSRDTSLSLAIIPGISLPANSDQAFAFIQYIDGNKGISGLFKYPLNEFGFSTTGFKITIGENVFSDTGMILNCRDQSTSIKGQVCFSGNRPYPSRLFSPGVMGWYRFVPTMQCYHGIVSMDHKLTGSIQINNINEDFDQGRGYIEKDWGTSMPLAWIWMQSNHFTQRGMSLSVSVAHVPWRTGAFSGFLVILSTQDKLYRFTTYTGARIRELSIERDSVRIRISDRKHTILISARGHAFGQLKAPVMGEMSRNIRESIGASVKLELHDRHGNLLLEDTAIRAGLEIVGDPDIIYSNLQDKGQ